MAKKKRQRDDGTDEEYEDLVGADQVAGEPAAAELQPVPVAPVIDADPRVALGDHTLGALVRHALERVEAHANALAEVQANNLADWAKQHAFDAVNQLKQALPSVVMLEQVLGQLGSPPVVVPKVEPTPVPEGPTP